VALQNLPAVRGYLGHQPESGSQPPCPSQTADMQQGGYSTERLAQLAAPRRYVPAEQCAENRYTGSCSGAKEPRISILSRPLLLPPSARNEESAVRQEAREATDYDRHATIYRAHAGERYHHNFPHQLKKQSWDDGELGIDHKRPTAFPADKGCWDPVTNRWIMPPLAEKYSDVDGSIHAATHTSHKRVPGVDAYRHSLLADVAAANGTPPEPEEGNRGRRMYPGCSVLTESDATAEEEQWHKGKRQHPSSNKSTFNPLLGMSSDPRHEGRPQSGGVRRLPQYKNMLSPELAAGW